jgi:hypothetical protein
VTGQRTLASQTGANARATKEIRMRELTNLEIEAVSGGAVPLIAWFALGYAIGSLTRDSA